MSVKFGTDGVRGVANGELTPELVLALGRAAARVLGGDEWFTGRDTRRSGPLLQAALAAGLAAEGATVIDLGVVPTPAVATMCAARGGAGAVVSASHNAFSDNGVKLFAPGGTKLSDEVEERLEAELASITSGAVGAPAPPVGAEVGTVTVEPTAVDWYVSQLVASLDGRRLDGLKVVVDCANGAASVVGPQALRAAGAEVVVIHAEPNGTNINEKSGSTHPDDLRRAVGDAGADAGLAFDGDADRVLAVDGNGDLVDGDHLIAICALDLRSRGLLPQETVAVTVMTNLGFRLAMEEHGIHVHETPVGDRHILAALEAHGWALGGEQSGHLIFRSLATTGDGILTGLQVLDVLARTGRPLDVLAGEAMTRLPQVLRNVRVDHRAPDLVDLLAGEVARVEGELGPRSRVLIRPSGTEPLVRVMVEAATEAAAANAADQLAEAVTRVLGPASTP
ncbi:MAG: phosphoglucosamine mutase [Actinomycetota bacterium]|nr:phosphoglucosamine mutase [Actinomycetota bacterium]